MEQLCAYNQLLCRMLGIQLSFKLKQTRIIGPHHCWTNHSLGIAPQNDRTTIVHPDGTADCWGSQNSEFFSPLAGPFDILGMGAKTNITFAPHAGSLVTLNTQVQILVWP